MFNFNKHKHTKLITSIFVLVMTMMILLPVSVVSAADLSVDVCLHESDTTTPLSGATVQYYASGNWRSFGTTDVDGCASKVIDSSVTDFRVNYMYTSQNKSQDTSSNNEVNFYTTPAIIKLANHDESVGFSAGAVYYYASGNWRTLGTTDVDGLASKELLPGSYLFRVGYMYTSSQTDTAVDIAAGNVADVDHTFNTTPATVELSTCSSAGIQGGAVYYYASGNWRTLGTTGIDGLASKELLPGSYRIRISYKYVTNETVDPIDITLPDSDKVFNTTSVTLNSNLNIQYYASGNWRTFSKPTMELLPASYHFRVSGHEFDLDVSGCTPLGGKLVVVSLFNGDESLSDPYKLECSGVGYLQSDVYFTDKTAWQCRGRFNGVAGPWFNFDPLDTILDYEFATVHVVLYNDTEGDGIDEADKLDAPHKVEVSGVGYFTSGDIFHVPADAVLSYRLRRNGIAGPWDTRPFDAGDTTWELQFATVDVVLYNDTGGDGIDEADKLDAPHKVEVSGVGYFTTDNTFDVPPGAVLSFRLRRNGIAGPWDTRSFDAGDTTWELQFATVHVTLHNGDDVLDAPHKVEVSGVGYYTSGDTFEVPPDAVLSFRLRRNGIAGPWDTQSFNAEEVTWSLEFATVDVVITLPPDVANQVTIEVSGVGYYGSGTTFDVPPGAKISFRLRNNGWAGPWFSTDDTGVFVAGDGQLIWGITPSYTIP